MGRSKSEGSPSCLACEQPIFSDACDERPMVCVFYLVLKEGKWVVRAKHDSCIGFSAKNSAITQVKVKGRGNHRITPQDVIGVAHEECVSHRMSSFDVVGNIYRSDARLAAQRTLERYLSKLQSA